jgi:hypothetical protein
MAIERQALGLVFDGGLPGDAKPGEIFEDSFSEV